MDLEKTEGCTTVLQGNNPTPPLPTRGGRGNPTPLCSTDDHWASDRAELFTRTRGGRKMPFGGGAIEFSDFLQGIVEDEDVVRHIRRDPHERISMDSLQ